MPAVYTEIPPELLDAFLTSRGFRVIPTAPGPAGINSKGLTARETVYGRRRKPLAQMVTLRVFTSFEKSHQRECGDDAIRVSLVTKTRTGDIKVIKGFKRVHRVAGWKKNLQQRLEEADQYQTRPCQCGGVLCERKGKNGVFLGCSNYPECRKTENVK